MENWEFSEVNGKCIAINREDNSMLVAPTRKEVENIIEAVSQDN